eukprot:3330724-Alexandrium_andersonii.AAC.1
MACIKKPKLAAAVSGHTVFMKNGPRTMKAVELKFLLPHQVLAILYSDYKPIFDKILLGGDSGKLGAFWRAMHEHPSWATHPIRDRDDHEALCIPIGFHGDGVP